MIVEILVLIGLVMSLTQFLKKPFPFVHGAIAIFASGVVSMIVVAARFPLVGTPFVPLTWLALSALVFCGANGGYDLFKVASGEPK